MTKHTDTPDPLGDMFEDMGIKVVDVTPNKHTDTDELREKLALYGDICAQHQSMLDFGRFTVDERNKAIRQSIDELGLMELITAYTTNRERALLDELEKIVNRRWGEITTDTGDKAVLRDHLNHFIKSKRGLQNQTNKENTHDQL